MSSWQNLFFLLARPLAPLYGLIMTIRAFLYRRGLLKTERLKVPVVSVGNLSMGGTGKTPLVMCVVRHLLERGRRPAIVSRGYGGKARGRVNVVSDGHGIQLTPVMAGDEPWLLAAAFPQVPVVTGARRVEVGRFVLQNTETDVIVLDDGFQHLALHRDFDLVLFSVKAPLVDARIFPAGLLREPISALRRAHAFIITGVDNRTERQGHAFKRFLHEHAPQAPVFFGEYLPVCVLAGGRNEIYPTEKAKRLKLCGFCGIGNPGAFRDTLAKEGYQMCGFKAFVDHHPYTGKDVEGLVAWARASKAQALITTEKDFVKLKPFLGDFPILALKVELFMEESFDLFLADRLGPFF